MSREIVAAVPPELVTLVASVLLLPICTLPKVRLAGFALRAAALATVPDNPMLSVGLDALLTIAKLPEAVPVLTGVKLTVKLVLWPALRLSGKLRPLTTNIDPVRLACVIVTVEVPVLVSVSGKLL